MWTKNFLPSPDLSQWGEGHPLSNPTPSAPRTSRLWRSTQSLPKTWNSKTADGVHLPQGKGLFRGFFGICAPLVWMGRMTYFLHRNVFDSYVKSWQYFRTDKISLESTFHWLSEGIATHFSQLTLGRTCCLTDPHQIWCGYSLIVSDEGMLSNIPPIIE